MTTRDYWRMTTRDYWRLPEITGFVARTLYAIWKSQERLQYGCISSILRTINSYFCRVITSSQSCSQLSRATSSFPELLPAPQGYYQLSTSSPRLLHMYQLPRVITSSPELLPAPQSYYQLSRATVLQSCYQLPTSSPGLFCTFLVRFINVEMGCIKSQWITSLGSMDLEWSVCV